eukprot:3781386-Prymnesium_polylepis.1
MPPKPARCMSFTSRTTSEDTSTRTLSTPVSSTSAAANKHRYTRHRWLATQREAVPWLGSH